MSQNQTDNSGVHTIPVNANDTPEKNENVQDNPVENTEENTQDNASIDPEIIEEESADQPQEEEEIEEEIEKTADNPVIDDNQATDEENKDKAAATDWKDSYIRMAAEFDNYRKRTSKEQDDIRRRECERVVKIWLEVYDNAERALESMTEKSGPWYEGFSSLIKQMDKALAQLHIKVVDDIGAVFDHKKHEAISIITDPTKENNTIAYVMQKGFVHENGDVVRVAKVVVVKNPS